MALKNDQYNQILREYDSRRLQNKHELDRRIEEAYGMLPQLKELEEENSKLKRMYANLSLVHEALKDAVSKKL